MPLTLEESRAAVKEAGSKILKDAEADGRGVESLNDNEIEQLNAKAAELKEIDEKIAKATQGRLLLSAFSDGAEAKEVPTGGHTSAATLGGHFAKNMSCKNLGEAFRRGGVAFSKTDWMGPNVKAATDTHVESGAVFADWLTDVDKTFVREHQESPVIADLLGTGTISGAAIAYFVEGPFEGDFATVAEAGQKPQFHVGDPVKQKDSLTKIAGWFDVSDEMDEDLPFYVSEINNRGLRQLAKAEQSQLLSGDGTGSNLTGLMNRSGVQTLTSAAGHQAWIDSVLTAIMRTQTVSGETADAIVIHPDDYLALRLLKDGNGQYIAGGPFQGQYGNGSVVLTQNLWNTKTVVSTAVTKGTALVGAFKAAGSVYRKGGVRVEATNSDQGKFTQNLRTVRIEERLLLAVRVPSALVKVTLTPPA